MGCGERGGCHEAQVLTDARTSHVDTERREAYGEMSASSYQSMVSLWGGLAQAGVIIDPPNHDRADEPASLTAIGQGLELIQPALTGFATVNAQTAFWLAFVFAYKVGARLEAFTCMRGKNAELPKDGETLLKEVKMTRPVARAFCEYWEAKGQDLAVNLDLLEAIAGAFMRRGSPRRICSGTWPLVVLHGKREAP